MAKPYQGSSSRSRRPRERTGPGFRLGTLLLKQTAAAVVCGLALWGMHSAQLPYAQALGRALRYESDLNQLREAGDSVFRWFQDRFGNRQPVPEPADSPAEPAEAAPPQPESHVQAPIL